MSPDEVLRFWFEETRPERWWQADPELDAVVRTRFAATHAAAARGELYRWRERPERCLAEIIVLDQFSRNIYRGTAQAFAYDLAALVLAQAAIAAGSDRMLAPTQRTFLYMPLMHSESLLIHEQAETLFRQPGLESSYEFELKHKRVIERFGRYPHRNAILGRPSTPEEIVFLTQPDSSF